ncbi:MAG: UDP-N-acetylmuramate dehydrogenase [Oscillospiraceae bacterium]
MDCFEAVIRDIRRDLPDVELREYEPMFKHTSFRIGGPARLMALPGGLQQAQALIRAAQNYDVPTFVIGSGTNILPPDGQLNALIIKTTPGLGVLQIVGTKLIAAAGVSLKKAAVRAQQEGLSGLEFSYGIPGSVGGAVFMNAGAYGGEMKDVVLDVEYIDDFGEHMLAVGKTLGFSYRRSMFSDKRYLITAVRMQLKRDDPEAIRERMNELEERRRASQPLDLPSAGSAFKRPEGGYAAALIEKAGLKGYRIGGAQVSPKHAGFIVNTGGATAGDVLELMRYVRGRVYAASGILLEPEIRVLHDG